MRYKHLRALFALAIIIIISSIPATGAEPSNAEYSCVPIFQVTATQPSILIILDNSGSMNDKAYAFNDYDHTIQYYGYFEPWKKYSYASNVFTRDTSGNWDGNFLNWAVMRRIDVARKVLMGGLATSRTGGGNQVNIGESPSGWDLTVNTGQTDIWGVTPFPGDQFHFEISGGDFSFKHHNGTFWSSEVSYTIKVQKDSSLADEESNFVDGNMAGVFQKIGTKAEWGLEFFRAGTGTNQSGGFIDDAIDDGSMTSMITNIQNTPADTWTPLAEAYYVAMTYFQQGTLASGLDYKAGSEVGTDPWEDKISGVTTQIPCAKGFVILLTDGASTMDQLIPGSLKNYADSFDTFVGGTTFPNSGSDYLKDVAYYARKNDLRADLTGDQNMILYPIFAFADISTPDGILAEKLLKEAAKNGGYVERDGIEGPNLQEEWDYDMNGVPDTYFRADNGYELEAQLLKAINDILQRAASGTSVSVLATSGEGEGTLSQAFFRPTIIDGTKEIEWAGYLQTTWIDEKGNMREDTVADKILNTDEDKIIVHFFDDASSEAKVKRYNVSATVPYPEITETTTPDAILALHEIEPLWEAGSMLAQRASTQRNIFTYIDTDNDGTEETVDFNTSSTALIDKITPYLGVRSSTAWSYLNTPAVSTERDRATNLINYIRGQDMTGLRSRSMDFDGDGDTEAWKLGDIVNSTPVTISVPTENFHFIYGDESFFNFYKTIYDPNTEEHKRETMVYVGANDGMLHAFTTGIYDSATGQYVKKSGTTENIGDELWAYVPKNLLPHLKWLPSENYAHTYYMDLKPKVFSAKIIPGGAGADTWGTILVAGFNLGGGEISVKADFNYDGDDNDANDTQIFNPAYVAINITDPRNPEVLWERSYQDLQMSSSIPSVMRVGDKWFIIFGSGPDDCNCEDSSTNKGHVFVVDLKTGEPYKNGTNDWLFETNEARAFMGSPAALDYKLNNNVDSVYIGESYFTPSSDLKGKLYKVSIPYTGSMDTYGSDPTKYLSTPSSWRFDTIFDIDSPITAAPSLSIGVNNNAWVYFGTGRYLNDDDKLDTSDQYLVGFKDPFFNVEHGDGTTFYKDNLFHNYTYPGSDYPLVLTDLLNSDLYTVYAGGDGTVVGPDLKGPGDTGTFSDFLKLVYDHDTGDYATYGKDGWVTTMTGGERVVVKPALLSGTVLVPSFTPNADVCGFGGDSMMFGLYFETGTAYYEPIFELEDYSAPVNKQIDIGKGKSSEVGIHVSPDGTAKAYSQKSTGEIDVRKVDAALDFKSGLKNWIEK